MWLLTGIIVAAIKLLKKNRQVTPEKGKLLNLPLTTTSRIYFSPRVLLDNNGEHDKYNSSMKKVIHKLCHLERQIYYLSFYYLIGLHQFFVDLILFQLYRNLAINPNELLHRLMSSEIIRHIMHLYYFDFFKPNQFILTYQIFIYWTCMFHVHLLNVVFFWFIRYFLYCFCFISFIIYK